MFANVAKKQSNIGIRLALQLKWSCYYTWQGWMMSCFLNSHILFLFLVQKKRLEVNVGEKWNLLSIIVNIGKSRQYCLNENINDSLFIKWDKWEQVLSDITKPRLPPLFWIFHLGRFWSRARQCIIKNKIEFHFRPIYQFCGV